MSICLFIRVCVSTMKKNPARFLTKHHDWQFSYSSYVSYYLCMHGIAFRPITTNSFNRSAIDEAFMWNTFSPPPLPSPLSGHCGEVKSGQAICGMTRGPWNGLCSDLWRYACFMIFLPSLSLLKKNWFYIPFLSFLFSYSFFSLSLKTKNIIGANSTNYISSPPERQKKKSETHADNKLKQRKCLCKNKETRHNIPLEPTSLTIWLADW